VGTQEKVKHLALKGGRGVSVCTKERETFDNTQRGEKCKLPNLSKKNALLKEDVNPNREKRWIVGIFSKKVRVWEQHRKKLSRVQKEKNEFKGCSRTI